MQPRADIRPPQHCSPGHCRSLLPAPTLAPHPTPAPYPGPQAPGDSSDGPPKPTEPSSLTMTLQCTCMHKLNKVRNTVLSKVWRIRNCFWIRFYFWVHLYYIENATSSFQSIKCSAEQCSAMVSSLASLPQYADCITGTNTTGKAHRNSALRWRGGKYQ